MATLFLSWCFDLISHLLTCHCLQITPRQPPTPSGRCIHSNTSSTSGRQNMKYGGEKLPASSYTFDWLTLIFVNFCHTRWHPSKCPTGTTNTPPNPSISSNTSTMRCKWSMKVRCREEGANRRGESSSEGFVFSFHIWRPKNMCFQICLNSSHHSLVWSRYSFSVHEDIFLCFSRHATLCLLQSKSFLRHSVVVTEHIKHESYHVMTCVDHITLLCVNIFNMQIHIELPIMLWLWVT
jgi:hypothetical protein